MSNTVTVIGNLSRDPELRYTPQGAAVVTISVADTPRNFDKASGQWQDGVTDWVKVVAWNALAENSAQSLKKGDRVIVIGKYVAEKYTDKTTNEEKSTRKLVAEEIAPSLQFAVTTVEKKSRSNNTPQGGGGATPDLSDASSSEMPF